MNKEENKNPYFGTAKEITKIKMKILNREMLTHEEIGKMWGCQRGSIQFLCAKALKKCRRAAEERGLSFADLMPTTDRDRGCHVAQTYEPWKKH